MTTNADGARSELTAGLDARRFPVLKPPNGCTTWVPWSALDAQWAMRIHGQTLERLAERGGLCPDEIFLNKHRLKWLTKVRDREAIDLCNEMASNALAQADAACGVSPGAEC